MSEDCGAAMLGIFLLESQARGEKGVVPGGVYQFFRAPFVPAPRVHRPPARTRGRQGRASHAHAFEYLDALVGAVFEQQMIEFRPPHFESERVVLV